MTTRRMQCFWTPYICIFASCAIADHDIWSAIIYKLQNLNNCNASEGVNQAKEETLNENKKTKDKEAKISPSNDPVNLSANSILTSFIKHVIVVLVIICLIQSHKENVNSELEDLREFWDPDTVDLMEWINKDIPKDAAFTGSMQLLAGVRLCTWRPLTNHPHFEDKDLRDRTREVIWPIL